MVSVSSCSVDFPDILPDPGFARSSSVHSDGLSNNEYSDSGNTDDFIREITERHNLSYSNVFCHTASEDEISNPFFSPGSSHHSLLMVDSNTDKSSCSSPDQEEDSSHSELEPRSQQGRNSYSLSSCSVSRVSPDVRPVDLNDFVVASDHEVDEVVRSGILINLSDEGASSEALDNTIDSTLKLNHLLTRQNTVFDTEQPDTVCLSPTSPMYSEKSDSLSVEQNIVSSPDTPTPQVHVWETEKEGSGVSITEPDELDLMFDDILETPREKTVIPSRRHSNCDPPSRGVVSLVPLYQRRTSLSHLTPLSPFYFTLHPPLNDTRKLSDPAACLRKEWVKNTHMTKQKRCLSDSEAPNLSTEYDDCKSDECESSALDSGYNDDKSSRFQDSLSAYYAPSSRVSLDNFSDDLMEPPPVSPNKVRRPTPYSPFGPKDGRVPFAWSWDDHTSHTQPNVIQPPPKRSLTRRQSQSSITASSIGASSESISVSSFWESQVSQVSATDLLSSLGFVDYDNPQLVPDRFIPKELEYIKPSMMKSMSFEEEPVYVHPAPSISTLSDSSMSSTPQVRPAPTNNRDLPLGATAENFLAPTSPPPQGPEDASVDKTATTSTTPLTTSNLCRYNTVLETVPEETASDLSPSPRWMSPRVSVDHSVIDPTEGKFGNNLNVQKVRKRSLPQREGYKLSIGSQVESETGDSIHVSVTSYDDELAAEKEREKEESSVAIPVEDCTLQRRPRRKGVYVPPASLLTWLTSQETIDEEEQLQPEELPWPFSEQAKLRVSLTELAQQETDSAELEIPSNHILGSSDIEHSILESDSSANLPVTPTCNFEPFNRNTSPEACDRSTLNIIESNDRIQPKCDLLNLSVDKFESPYSLKRRSRSVSPLSSYSGSPTPAKVLQTTDDMRLVTAVPGTMSHDTVQRVMYKDRDYRSECQWLRTELNDLEASSRSTEHTLSTKVNNLENSLFATEKRLTRQTALNQDLQQELESAKRQLKETKHSHAAALVAMRTEAKQMRISELQELKNKFGQEKTLELSLIQDKHAKEQNDLKKTLQAKNVETQQITTRLSDRVEACSALSSELRESRKQGEARESKLKAQLTEERSKWEKIYHQEKVSALAKLQEQAAADKQKELSSLKDKLLEDKKAALSRLEQKTSEQVSKLQHQLAKSREQNHKEMVALREGLEKEVVEGKQKTDQAKQVTTSVKLELERLQKVAKATERRHQFKDRESQKSVDENQRSILNGVMDEWSRSAEAVGKKRPRPYSTGNVPVISATENALLGLKMTNELLRQQLSDHKEQLEKEKLVGMSAHRDKMTELRRLKAFAQMDKQKALKSLAEKLKKECDERKEDSNQCPSNREQSLQEVEVPYLRETIQGLEKDLNTQQRTNHRTQSLYKDKCQEVNNLQAKIKQLAKEQLLLERVMQHHINTQEAPQE